MAGTEPAFPRFCTGVAENFGKFRPGGHPGNAVFCALSRIPGIWVKKREKPSKIRYGFQLLFPSGEPSCKAAFLHDIDMGAVFIPKFRGIVGVT